MVSVSTGAMYGYLGTCGPPMSIENSKHRKGSGVDGVDFQFPLAVLVNSWDNRLLNSNSEDEGYRSSGNGEVAMTFIFFKNKISPRR